MFKKGAIETNVVVTQITMKKYCGDVVVNVTHAPESLHCPLPLRNPSLQPLFGLLQILHEYTFCYPASAFIWGIISILRIKPRITRKLSKIKGFQRFLFLYTWSSILLIKKNCKQNGGSTLYILKRLSIQTKTLLRAFQIIYKRFFLFMLSLLINQQNCNDASSIRSRYCCSRLA